MAQRDLGDIRDRAQIYEAQIDGLSLNQDRSTGNIKTAGFQRADVFVDFVRDVVDKITITHESNDFVEQIKNESALPVIELEDLVYEKEVVGSSKFKFSIDLNSEFTELIFGALSAVVESAVFNGVGLDDATSSGSFTGDESTEYLVEIDATGTPDTFKWSKDGGATWEATGVSITGAAQLLDEGVSVTFAATTGHTLGDQWTIKAGYGSSSDLITVDISLR